MLCYTKKWWNSKPHWVFAGGNGFGAAILFLLLFGWSRATICSTRLPPSWHISYSEPICLGVFDCAHRHFRVAGFSSSRSGTYEVKRKPREHTTYISFLGLL